MEETNKSKINKNITYHQCTMEWLHASQSPFFNKAQYGELYKYHMETYIGHCQIADLDSSNIQKFMNQKLADGGTHEFLVNMFETLNNVFEYAITKSYITYNPCSHIYFPPLDMLPMIKKSANIYTKKDVKKIINFVFNDNKQDIPHCCYVPIYVFMLNTGISKSEILQLRWSSIVERNGIVYALILYNIDRKSDSRLVPLNGTALMALEMIEQNHKASQITSDFIVCNHYGSQVIADDFTNTLKDICHINDIVFKGVHALVDTFAINMLATNMNISILSKILGDKSVGDTYTKYSQILDEYDALAIHHFEILANNFMMS